jgi:hypothetical protein
MNDCIQFLNAGSHAAGHAKRDFGKTRTIDGSVRIQDFTAEAADNFLIYRLTRTHQFVSNSIGLNEVGPEFHKHLGDSGLAGCDATCKAKL